MNAAKTHVRHTFDHQKMRALGEVNNLAAALRLAVENLEDASFSGGLLVRTAEAIENVARDFEAKDFDAVVDDVKEFTRRNPVILVAAVAAIGFAAARFFKSSSAAVERAEVEFTSDVDFGEEEPSSRAEDFIRDNPLLAGLAIAAAGALVGALVPATQTEHEILGPKRDELIDRGKRLARDGIDRVERWPGTLTEARE